MAQPATNTAGVLTGSGFIKYLEGCRRHEMEAYDAIHAAAGEVAAGIRRAGGRKWAVGIDTRLLARRLTRPMRHAADLHLEAAKALNVAAMIFNASLAPQTGSRGKQKVFDASK
jgi:hypothetical protein